MPLRFAFLLSLSLLIGAGSAWARPAATDVSGTWTGTLPIDGASRAVAVQLYQRADGSLLGYVLGGGALTAASGSSAGGRVMLRLERVEPPGRTRAITVDGRLRGGRLRGTANDGSGPRAIDWSPRTAEVCERRLVAGPADSEELVEVAVATDCRSGFLGGFFSARDVCGTLGCSGAVTSFSESGGAISLSLASGGACAGTSTLRATFDSTARAYHGSYSVRDCRGPSSGPLVAARWTRTRASDVKGVFAALGRLADDLERGAGIAAPYSPVSPSYLHLGTREADLLSSLRAETASYSSIEVAFGSFRGFRTTADPTTFPELDGLPGVDFHDRRLGTPRSGGPAVLYRNTDTDFTHSELKYLRAEAGAWKIVGNQSAPFDLPFRWEAGVESLGVPALGRPVYVSVGPFGAHFPPLTGHAYGDPKANLVGFFSKDNADLVEMAGDGSGDEDGTCEAGEGCAFATTAAEIRERTPVYVAPLAGTVTEVTFRGPAPGYFENAQRWAVRLRLDAGLEIRFDHLARIAPALRDLIRAATGIDTDTYASDTGDLLGGAALRVAAGTELARPQVFASEVPGRPGVYRGGGDFDRPWAQMEFFVSEDGRERCVFDLLPADRRASIQEVMDREMADPAAQRYGRSQPLRWTWAAEGLLCPTPAPEAALFAHGGAWFERPAPVADEMFAIVPIAREARSWNPALYSAKVDSLVLRRRRPDAGPFSWAMPDATTAMPFYPNGEVLERTETGLLIRWRDVGRPEVFQRAAYLFDVNLLKVRWGNFAATAAGATMPALSPATPCDGADVVCYDAVQRPGF